VYLICVSWGLRKTKPGIGEWNVVLSNSVFEKRDVKWTKWKQKEKKGSTANQHSLTRTAQTTVQFSNYYFTVKHNNTDWKMNCEFAMQHRYHWLCRRNWTERAFLRWTKLITLRFALLLCNPSCARLLLCVPAFLRTCSRNERHCILQFVNGQAAVWIKVVVSVIWFKIDLLALFGVYAGIILYKRPLPIRLKSNHTVWYAWTVGGWGSLCTALKSSQRPREGLCSESLWVLPLWFSLAGLPG